MFKNGIFLGSTKRNEKTGYSQFVVKLGNTNTVYTGVIIEYPKYAPVRVEISDDQFVGMRLYDEDSSSLIDFLCSKSFHGSGVSTVNGLLSKSGDHLFEAIKNNSIKYNKTEKVITDILSYYLELEDVFDFALELGFDYYVAKYIFDHFDKIHSIETINNNPYLLTWAKVNYEECEKIAFNKGMKSYDRKRIKALVKDIIEANRSFGNTLIELNDLLDRTAKLESKNGLYKTDELFILEHLLDKEYHIEHKEDKTYIYSSEDYDTELNIARYLNNLNNNEVYMDINEDMIKAIETSLNITYSPEQLNAIHCLKNKGLKLITGGPGTGKTTLLRGIIACIKKNNPHAEIRLCAPTGCAAKRMADITGMPATTIHKLLNIMPFEGNTIRSRETIKTDVLIIDESSMVDMYIFDALINSLENTSLIIMMGDVDQLPPIGVGYIYKDLIDSEIYDTYVLRTVFRQENNYITENSYKVIHGDITLDKGKNFDIHRYNDEESILNALNKYVDYFKKSGITGYKVYTSCKKSKFKLSTANINKLLKTVDGQQLEYGFNTFGIKDKVMFVVNNYEKGYFNGQEGEIVNIQKVYTDFYVTVRSEGEEYTLSGNELDDIELSYAITAHKSQGGECDVAIIVLPETPISMLKRRLLYVEITRARKNVILLVQGKALEKCISSYGEYERITGLRDKLKKSAKI